SGSCSCSLDCMDPTCSGRGVCVRGECHCSVGWGGANCETPRATCLDQCSGHGTFLSETGLCTCDPNWTGHDCSTEICVADCGVHGTCVGGSCRCEEGWMGAACDQRACHPRCNEHGTCRDGKCECSPGWNGEHCTIGKRKKLDLYTASQVSLFPTTIWLLILPTSERWKAESTLSLVRFELPNCRQPAGSRSSLQYCALTTAPPRL
uniref:EGF-like domain-containing protein n=1 Tax=Naja naja TaxID=35670 RepID=A0A8C6XMS0_NAJNA